MKTKTYFLLLLATGLTFNIAKTYAIATVKLTTSSIPLADVNQGTLSVIVYAAKMEVTIDPVTVNSITFTLSGTHDNNDLTTASIYYNPTTPDLVGASFLNSTSAAFAAPHTYSGISINRTLAVGEDGYFVITVNISNTGTDNKTVQINGDIDPVTFGYTTAPNVDDQQTNKAKAQKIQAPDITLTSSSIPLADVNQGTLSVIVYAAKMVNATMPVTVNSITFTLSGTHDNNDLTTASIYYNPTTPDLVGASFLNSTSAAFAAPHTYSGISINRTLAAGEDGYFVITVNISNTGTDNKTVQINGDIDPVTFGYTTAPNVDDQQTNKAKAQKIQAPDITLTSSSIPLADVNQGTLSVIVYAAKMVNATMPVTVNSITFTLSGTHDNNDLTTASIYYNPTTPDLVGASFLNSTSAAFAAPHTYSGISINRTLAVGEDGYFVITVNISNTGTDNKTVQINGDIDPVTFGYTTAPNVDDQQTNKAKAQKIQAPDITLTSSSIPLADVNQGTLSVIVYAAKMVNATMPVTVNSITFTLSGTHDNNDLTTASIYYNPTTPDLVGASFLNSTSAAFAAPHTYSGISINRTLAVGEDGYFVITVNISNTGTDNKTVQINGDIDPVTFGYTTAPNVDDQQTNKAKAQKIQAPDITLTSSSIPLADVNQGTLSVIVYAAKMVNATMPVTVNSITFTLSGTHDNNDLTTASIYYNPTTPDLVGASFLNSTSAAFAAPHTYSGISINRTLAVGEDGYFVITVNISNTGTDNKTVQINGDIDPVTFGYTTAPNVDDQQTNKAKAQKIQAPDITLTTSTIAAGNILQGSTSNIVYAVEMDVATQPVTVNSITFTLSGTHDNNDLTTASIYYNPTTPDLVGASFLNSTSAAFAAPHTYSGISINRTLAIGEDGYFVIVVNVSATATIDKTVTINGNNDPVIFGFTTAPNVVDNQSNAAGKKTIKAGNPRIGDSNVLILNDIYPNPAAVAVNYSLSVQEDREVTVQLMDQYGKTLSSERLFLSTGINNFKMDVSSLSNGIYYLVASDASNSINLTERIVVQH